MDSSAVIAQALEKVRYPELLEISVDGVEHVLVACLDEGNGGIQWNPVVSSDASQQQKRLHSFHLQTKRWIFPMLNDTVRNDLYQRAIQAAVQQILQDNTNEEFINLHVLDIGTGTGLLGMLVCQAVQENNNSSSSTTNVNVKVTAVEMASAMAQIAQRTIQGNPSLGDSITVLNGHSSEMDFNKNDDRPVQLCVSELLESGLLGEGILPSLRHVWEQHEQRVSLSSDEKTPDLIMVPRRARVFAQVVQVDNPTNDKDDDEWFLPPCSATTCSSSTLCGLSYSLDQNTPLWKCIATSGSSTHDGSLQMSIHADKLLRDGTLQPLTEPVQVLTFDFTSADSMPGLHNNGGRTTHQQSSTISVPVTRTGKTHAILVFWELDIWDDLTYSTEPGKQPWQDHWQTCLHLVPNVCDTVQGDILNLQAAHSDDRLFVSIQEEEQEDSRSKRARIETVPPAFVISPFRASQLYNVKRINCWKQAIENAISNYLDSTNHDGSDPLVLDLNDFGIPACLAASLGAKHVVSVESSGNSDLVMAAARLAQVGNGFPREGCKFELLQCHVEQLSVEVLGAGKPADIVIGAEYMHAFEGWHWQEALNFHYTLRALRKRNVVSPEARIIPARARLMAYAIESTQLREAYRPCGSGTDGRILGLDHSYLNEVGGDFFRYDLCLPMWQYEYRVLSDKFEIAVLAFDKAEVGSHDTFTVDSRTVFRRSGRFDAIIYWVEYDFGDTAAASTKGDCFSTHGRTSCQLVRMIQSSIEVTDRQVKQGASIRYRFLFGGLEPPLSHDLNFSVDLC